MFTFKNITKIILSIGTVIFLSGCGNGGGSSHGGDSAPGDGKQNKVYSNECSQAILLRLNLIYTFHKEYEFYHLKKADSLIAAHRELENTLALYSPISCQIPQPIVEEAKLKTSALDDEEMNHFLDQIMNESLLEHHQCQTTGYAKNEREKYQCRTISKFVKDNGWIN